ncbi:hypothetical protein Tco_0256909 [Tanacetum coccineum]
MAPSVVPTTISPIKTKSITIKHLAYFSGMTNGREESPPPGFSTLTPLPGPNVGELPPITVSTFTARTLENTPLANHASTLANPNPAISPAFIEANYEVLESLLRERRRQMHNKDLRTELEYYSEEGRVVEFEEALNKDGSKVERESEGRRPSEQRAEDNENHRVNLPPLLAAHLGRNENDQPLHSMLTSAYGGHQSSNNSGGNLPPNSTHLSYSAPPFIPNSIQPFSIQIPTHVNPELRHQIKEAMKTRQLAHLIKGIKKGKAKVSDTQLGEWKKGDKDTTPAKTPILMINREDHTSKRKSVEDLVSGIGKITFPLFHVSTIPLIRSL